MSPQKLLTIPCILLPLAASLSIGCGILAFPVEAPEVAITNAQRLNFTVNIVDISGQPLNGITINATRHALTVNPLVAEIGEDKLDKPRVVDKTLAYDAFGNYAVTIEYGKPGFTTRTILYARKDDAQVRSSSFLGMPASQPTDRVNITQHPHSTVTLFPAP